MLLLSGCSTAPKLQPVYKTKTIRVICIAPPVLEPISTKPIKFELATNEDGLKVLGLSEQSYKNLAENTQAFIEYIKKARLVINHYKQCIDDHNKKADQED